MTLRPLTLIGIIVSIVTGISLGVLAHVVTRDRTPADASATLSEALRQVAENYVEEVSEEELLNHAIEGMMQSLDDHSDYLSARDFEALQSSTTGEFGGIGIELGLVGGYFTIIAPIDDTPAARAGLLAGDRIEQINAEPVKGKRLDDLIDALRGAPGTTLTLHIRRDAETLKEVELTRDKIAVASVRGRLLEPDIGYLRISQFQDRTSLHMVEVLEDLTAEAAAPLEGLVIDLRNNPGGTLQSSVEVADHFLEDGLIVYTEGRLPSSFAKYRATRGDLLEGMPIVVLINSGSASASEIVAGALQDHGRAQLMGSTSYGKGSVQSVLPLHKDQAIKITTAYYFTPNGRSIHEIGIEPDVAFDGDEEILLAEAVALLRTAGDDTRQARL